MVWFILELVILIFGLIFFFNPYGENEWEKHGRWSSVRSLLHSTASQMKRGRLEPSDKHLAGFLVKLLRASILLLISILNKQNKYNSKFVDISPISNGLCSSNPGKKKLKKALGYFAFLMTRSLKIMHAANNLMQ